jgi:hypothetical protein
MATKDPNKVDLKLDPGLREQVEAIALEKFGAKVHHISHRPEITTALNRLIKMGITALESGYLDNNPDAIPIPPSPDLEAVVREQVQQAIAAMPKPEPAEPNLEELAGAVVALLTDEQKKP